LKPDQLNWIRGIWEGFNQIMIAPTGHGKSVLWIGLLVARDLWDKAEMEYMTGQGKPYSIVSRTCKIQPVSNLSTKKKVL
jgi:hypothetical protein